MRAKIFHIRGSKWILEMISLKVHSSTRMNRKVVGNQRKTRCKSLQTLTGIEFRYTPIMSLVNNSPERKRDPAKTQARKSITKLF
jgi:hypothetical protein